MKTLTTLTAALVIASATGAFAGHPHVGDAARTSDENQSSNASKGWDKVSTNGSNGKAAAAADKTRE